MKYEHKKMIFDRYLDGQCPLCTKPLDGTPKVDAILDSAKLEVCATHPVAKGGF